MAGAARVGAMVAGCAANHGVGFVSRLSKSQAGDGSQEEYSVGGSSFGGGALSAEQQEQMVRSIYTNIQMAEGGENMSLENDSGWGWFTAAEDTGSYEYNLGKLNAIGAFGEGTDESQHEEPVEEPVAPHRQSRHHDQQRGADRRPPARPISACPPLLLDCGEDGGDLIVAPHQLLMAMGGSLRDAVEFERQHTSTTPPRSLANSFYEHA